MIMGLSGKRKKHKDVYQYFVLLGGESPWGPVESTGVPPFRNLVAIAPAGLFAERKKFCAPLGV
jgi:hypothetical protein